MRTRRQAARDRRQGAQAKERAERERIIRVFLSVGAAEMERTGALFWPPFTDAQIAEAKAERVAEEMIKSTPHAFVANFGPVSRCNWCGRPKRARMHQSKATFSDICKYVMEKQ